MSLASGGCPENHAASRLSGVSRGEVPRGGCSFAPARCSPCRTNLCAPARRPPSASLHEPKLPLTSRHRIQIGDPEGRVLAETSSPHVPSDPMGTPPYSPLRFILQMATMGRERPAPWLGPEPNRSWSRQRADKWAETRLSRCRAAKLTGAAKGENS